MASEIKVDTISEKTSAGGVTIDGLLIKDGGISGDVSLIGTTPTFTIGDAGAEDAALVFDGNAQDFYIALDDSADDLLIGLGSTVGTTPMLSFTEAKAATFAGAVSMASTLDVTTVATAATFEPDGDTSSGDNAAIGYAAAEGLILTGQGSTGDVTIKNDADTVVAYVPTGTDDLLFPDNAKLIFGTGSDFTIVHDGSNTKLTDAGTGSLYIQASDNIVLRSADEGETFLTCADDGAVKLYNNNVLHFETSGNGCKMNDSIKLLLGDSEDLEIFHDGSHSYITDSGTGDLKLNGSRVNLFSSGSFPHISFTNTATGDGIFFDHGAASDLAGMTMIGGEGKGAFFYLSTDQEDDNADKWVHAHGDVNAAGGGAVDNLLWSQYSGGSWDHEMSLTQGGVLTTEGAMNASTTVDYAEYFEWKTELANDTAVTNAYGMTVVLDSGKVRLAEAGEEAKVLGAVRPNNTSAMVGGEQTFKWKDKYETDVWGIMKTESYTACKWNELDAKGEITKRFNLMKDRLPAKKLKREIDCDTNSPFWTTETRNYELDGDGNTMDFVIPTTEEEKLAANYREESKIRPKVNSSYDPSLSYTSRGERRKEWAIVGLLGQVPIRDTAIVPTSWTKMKNLESGIDLYYIK